MTGLEVLLFCGLFGVFVTLISGEIYDWFEARRQLREDAIRELDRSREP